jgi:hypothetical protein
MPSPLVTICRADLVAGVLDGALDLEVLGVDDGLRVAAGLHQRRRLELDLEPRVRHGVRGLRDGLAGCRVECAAGSADGRERAGAAGDDADLRLRSDHGPADRFQRAERAVAVLELLLQLLVGPCLLQRTTDGEC